MNFSQQVCVLYIHRRNTPTTSGTTRWYRGGRVAALHRQIESVHFLLSVGVCGGEYSILPHKVIYSYLYILYKIIPLFQVCIQVSVVDSLESAIIMCHYAIRTYDVLHSDAGGIESYGTSSNSSVSFLCESRSTLTLSYTEDGGLGMQTWTKL